MMAMKKNALEKQFEKNKKKKGDLKNRFLCKRCGGTGIEPAATTKGVAIQVCQVCSVVSNG
jgi:transcription elongation factor Elf1